MMRENQLVISKGCFSSNSLSCKTVLITGGGGGIGFEAARSLVWLGANVIIAEIDKKKGKEAEKAINEEFGTQRAYFFHADISLDKEINKLYSFITKKFGFLDVIINNATITPMGAIHKVGINSWDKSYAVNLRATILLIEKFLPDMISRNSGVIAFVPSSGAAPYMGAYEVFKTAQVELCNTLVGELENTNIITFSIGPGLVKTETALEGIKTVAGLMGISMEEFFQMNDKHMLSVESAGAGFAASIVNASKYNGQEIGSIQALMDANIIISENNEYEAIELSDDEKTKIINTLSRITKTYNEQYSGWLKRNVFERQWVLRDFKKETGLSTEQMKDEINNISLVIQEDNWGYLRDHLIIFKKLQGYYKHQLKLLSGYEKDVKKLEENKQIINEWIDDLNVIIEIVNSGGMVYGSSQ